MDTILDALPAKGRTGWTAVAALLLVMTVCHGIITSGLPTLDKAILADLRISRGDLKLREAIFLMSSGVSGLLIGFATLRVRPAFIVLSGLLLLSATLLAYAQARTIGTIYLLYLLLGLAFASAHVVVIVLMIRERFDARRAFATSVALSGTSLGAMLFPQITVSLVELGGWRQALQWLALLPLGVLPVAAVLLLRGGGAKRVVADASAAPTAERAPARSAGTTALLLVATFGTFYASTAFLLNLFLYLQDNGLTARAAAAGMSTIFAIGLVGKVLVGLAAERWGPPRVWIAAQSVLLAGALVLTTAHGGALWLGLVLLGAGWAGCYVLTQVVIAGYFAGPKLGQMTGLFIVFEAIASATGVWTGGMMFDVFGTYRTGFALCCVLVLVALVTGFFFVRRLAPAGAASPAMSRPIAAAVSRSG
jgi:MFS family permease